MVIKGSESVGLGSNPGSAFSQMRDHSRLTGRTPILLGGNENNTCLIG